MGDISWPEHVGIFTIPVRAAVQHKVPLIVWGENSQNEYGGPAAATQNKTLTRAWLEEFGGLLGLRVNDLNQSWGIEKKHLINYTYPSDEELQSVGVTGLFLGHFFEWDGLSNALIAQANGFTTYARKVEGSMVNYENLDNHQTGIHDYFKYLKFGFGRATDIASLHIRRGRITREQGIKIVTESEGRFPWEYLGKSLQEILDPLDLGVPEFEAICDRFTNKALFVLESDGTLKKDRHRNLEKMTPHHMTQSIAIIDYGCGNLASVQKAVTALGFTAEMISDPSVLGKYGRAILPGVGNFNAAMSDMTQTGLADSIKEFSGPVNHYWGSASVCSSWRRVAQRAGPMTRRSGLDLVPGDVVSLTFNGRHPQRAARRMELATAETDVGII